jgi:hypothetical protein
MAALELLKAENAVLEGKWPQDQDDMDQYSQNIRCLQRDGREEEVD